MGEGMGWIVVIPVVTIIGGFVIAALGMIAAMRKREMAHRERLAMIEKGLVPEQAPVGPAGGGSAKQALLPDSAQMWQAEAFSRESARAAQIRRGGFVVCAVGLGLFLMLYFISADIRPAAGMGAFLVVLGAAIFLSSYMGGGARDGAAQPPGTTGRR